MRSDQRGFVLNGIALLLVLPAFLLAGVGLKLISTAQETVAIQLVADKVFYTSWDLDRTLDMIWIENVLFDNESNTNRYFRWLAENYRAATGMLVEIAPSWKFWIHVDNNGADHYAGTKYCKIARGSLDNWFYYFEDLDEATGETPDWDYNEPILRIEKIGEKLKVTIEAYGGRYWADIYYGDDLIWENIRSDNVGISTWIPSTVQLSLETSIMDPNHVASRTSTVKLC